MLFSDIIVKTHTDLTLTNLRSNFSPNVLCLRCELAAFNTGITVIVIRTDKASLSKSGYLEIKNNYVYV